MTDDRMTDDPLTDGPMTDDPTTDGPVTDHPRLVQTVLDGEDIRALAEFYRQLLGMTYREGDEPRSDGPDDADWLVLRGGRGGSHQLAFQRTERLVPTTWPSPEVPMQLHLDCTVPDRAALDGHRRRAEALGARLVLDRSDDADEPLYVLADPADHPFCLFVG